MAAAGKVSSERFGWESWGHVVWSWSRRGGTAPGRHTAAQSLLTR